MKNNFTARCWISFVLLISSTFYLKAQVREPFDQLNLEAITSQFFYPQTYHDVSVPDGSGYDQIVDYADASRLFCTFDRACLSANEFISDYSAFHMSMLEVATIQNCMPIAILDISYHDFIPTVLSDELIYIEGDKFYDSPTQFMSPYVQKNAMVPWICSDYALEGEMKFLLKQEWYITNKAMPISIEMDFDDGLGFRPISFEEVITVNYPENAGERIVRVKINRTGGIQKAGVVLKELSTFYPCETTSFPFPTAAPWPTNGNMNFPWEIATVYQGELVKGNAFTLTSDDGVFDKPFIFVEGIDFGYEGLISLPSTIYRNGSFGWCEFSSGFVDPDPTDDRNYGYDMLQLMPDMLNEIRSYGYDIVLVDFEDGADFIQKNAELVQHIIRLCNEYKSGDEPLVVSGASMGGVVTRYALRKMEMNGEDHCTRLWLSVDAPHAGANIPIAIQSAVKFFADNGVAEAGIMFNQMLRRPAAIQLLNVQYDMSSSYHDQFYAELESMGYPEKSRTMAICNGVGTNVEIPHDMFPLVDWECNTIFDDIAEVYLCPSNGDEYNVIARISMPTYLEDAAGDEGWINDIPLIGDIGGLLDFENLTIFSVGDQPNLDYAPGGTRSSVKEFGRSLGSNLLDCPIGEHQYNDNHCFVATASAVGLMLENPNLAVEQYLLDNPQLQNFDEVFYATAGNEVHVELTPYNIDNMLNEILAPDRMELGDELTSASGIDGSFNFGKSGYNWLRDLHIHDGGVLMIHEDFITHYATSLDIYNDDNYFSVTTNECSPSEILVDELGEIRIGSELNSLRYADLIVNRDSKLIIGNGGSLKLFHDSRIVLNEGAEMILHDGSDCKVYSGGIILNPGSKLIIQGGTHDFLLDEAEARIELNGGKIILEDGAELIIHGDENDCGFIRVADGESDVITNGENSRLLIQGKGNYNTILEVGEYARFGNSVWHNGEIMLQDGRVDMHHTGAISTDMKFSAEDVKFVSDGLIEQFADPASLQVWGNQCALNRCEFDRVKVTTHESISALGQCDFQTDISGFHSFGGSYEIRNSHFDDCKASSESLAGISKVYACVFEGDDSGVDDFSLVEVVVSKSSFIGCDYQAAVDKRGGKISVSCSDFDTHTGIRAMDAYVNVSGTDMAGYNNFSGTGICIQLVNASGINLYKGRNIFSSENAFYVSGTLNIPCLKSHGCQQMLDAYNNHWGTYASGGYQPNGGGNTPPDPDKFDVQTSDISSCLIYEYAAPCPVLFKDLAPIGPMSCPLKIKPEVKSLIYHGTESTSMNEEPNKDDQGEFQTKDNEFDLENPIISTLNFNEVTLDSALVFAAMQMESYDSLANDADAVKLFREILTSGLELQSQEIRYKMNWARQNMKAALENLFFQGDLIAENNQTAFQLPVQYYVDVLNLMTDTALTDSTYQAQFYLELDKGQLFRTIGKLEITQQVFTHLNDCDLDSLEQFVLNSWRQQVDLEMSRIEDYYLLELPIDSLSESVDTTNYDQPVELLTSDYYFGLWIDSPQSVTFVQCGDNPYYRWLWNESTVLGIYPNPTNGTINLSGLQDEMNYAVTLYDLTGRAVFQRSNLNSTNGSIQQLTLPQSMVNGSYLLKVQSINGVYELRVIIQK
ncbi:MAG: T9SS type A sorting domain-containing protein [Flavobacteriales bacterium]|nr:T9SS type A sorting domain-containing protein [Flavobacteriales bacterium]